MQFSKKRFPVLEIAKINLRHNALLSIAVAVLLCLVTPLLIGTANLDRNSAAMPLEMFVSLVGVVLLSRTRKLTTWYLPSIAAQQRST